MKNNRDKFLDERSKNSLKVGVALILLFFTLLYIKNISEFFQTTYTIIRPVIYGLIIAFIINMPMKFFQEKVFGKFLDEDKHKKLINVISIILSWIVFFAIITVILTVLIPELVSAIESLIDNLPIFFDKLISYLENNKYFKEASYYMADIVETINPEKVRELIRNLLTSGSKGLLNRTSSIINSLSSTTIAVIMGFIFSIYVSLNKEDLKKNINKVLFAHLDKDKVYKVNYVAKLSYVSFARFLEGRILSCISLGLISFIGMKILGLPMAGMISILVGVFDIIPYFGPIIATGIGMILIFIQSPAKSIIFLIFILIIQQIQEQIVYPLVIGKNQGLPAIWIFLSVLLGGRLFGIAGMIGFMPIATIFYTLLEDRTRRKLKEKEIRESEVVHLGEKSFDEMREETYEE
ncbi:AI-2E family transporter [Anaerococcus sp. AGMB09787]|uniref:AI-2E family transporter n=1 Tax=Anaerococcus sp. AGMB09787 TaxID=2922869 RepID=UPI001FAEA10A|nr:AI-2E family transporter [Anaerococcus sp. AGMB09787]